MSCVRPLSVLLLCDFDPFGAQMVQDSIHAIASRSTHKVCCLSFRGDLPDALDPSCFDAILIHYSALIYSEHFISARTRQWIRHFPGFKAIILHDEYQNVNQTKAALAEMKINALFTCFALKEANKVYYDLVAAGLSLFSVLPGYVGPTLLQLDPGNPASSRPIDIGYRGRQYPPWHGELGMERVRIHEGVVAAAPKFGLVIDSSVAERDRLYGAAWFRFQRQCKAMLGTESGASVIDFTGEIARQVEAHENASPETGFVELRRLYFADVENQIMLRTISPRIFEGIASGCALILYEGEYAGRLKPYTHYAPLRKDHGNFDEIAAFLREGRRLDQMVAIAREEVLLAPENQESTFISLLDSVFLSKAGEERVQGYEPEAFNLRFGRYDNCFTRPVIKRQLFRMTHRAYSTVSGMLPKAAERRLTATLRGILRR
jgi:hypothetical protein